MSLSLRNVEALDQKIDTLNKDRAGWQVPVKTLM
jgi:hypothetical protein